MKLKALVRRSSHYNFLYGSILFPCGRTSHAYFITMDNADDADWFVEHLKQSILEGRYITVKKPRRKCPRTLAPGHYLGLKNTRDASPRGDRGRYHGGSFRVNCVYRHSLRRSPPYRGTRDYSPRHHSPYGGRSRRELSRSLPPYSPCGSRDSRSVGGSR